MRMANFIWDPTVVSAGVHFAVTSLEGGVGRGTTSASTGRCGVPSVWTTKLFNGFCIENQKVVLGKNQEGMRYHGILNAT